MGRTVAAGLAMLMLCMPAAARMYQWVNPETGHTQMSGKPPAWYRGTAGGPRVQVFENGKLVDDTAHAVSDAERTALRATAMQASERAAQVQPAAAKTPGAPVIDQQLDARLTEAIKSLLAPQSKPAERPEQSAPAADDTTERLKAIIADWERRKTEGAKSLIRSED